MARRRLENQRVLITGASSGIGLALAHELARHRATLILTARRADRLKDLAQKLKDQGTVVHPVPGDITDPDHRQCLVQLAQQELEGLDVLINNAGVGAVGPFAQASPDRLRRVMEVNFFAPAELIRLCLPLLRASASAAIVNIGSVLSHVSVPNKSEYCASKFALHGLNDSLHAELARDHIDVILICPTTTRSEFYDSVLERASHVPRNPWPMSAETVARRTARALARRKREVVLSSGARAMIWLDRLAPSLLALVMDRLHRGGSGAGTA